MPPADISKNSNQILQSNNVANISMMRVVFDQLYMGEVDHAQVHTLSFTYKTRLLGKCY
jgi:hypothetical protein